MLDQPLPACKPSSQARRAVGRIADAQTHVRWQRRLQKPKLVLFELEPACQLVTRSLRMANEKRAPGPAPERLQIEGSWEDAVSKVLRAPRPKQQPQSKRAPRKAKRG